MLARVIAAVILTLSAAAGVFYFSSDEAQTAGPERSALLRVEKSAVCMVQDRVSFMKNIPVDIEGKTYYGCCPNCVGRLLSTGTIRYSTDPVTGNLVDKADAFIVSREDGTVIYFESEKTASDYDPAGGASEKSSSL